MKNIQFLISLAFFVLISSVFQTSYSMEDFKLENPDSSSEIKKETDVMLEPLSEKDKKALDKRILKHPSNLELSYQPLIQQSAPLFRSKTPPPSSSLQEVKEGFLKPKTPPSSSGGLKVMIRKSPDLIHECSPLIPTNATPLRPRTPSPSNPREIKEDFFKS